MNQWKINFILLLAITAFATVTLFVVGTDILKDLKVKEYQINKLIDEVGAIKGERETARLHSSANAQATVTLPNEQLASVIQNANTAETSKQNIYLIVGQHSKLTDTIMIAVIDHEKKRITLISIPRDFYVNGRKINEYYQFFGIQKLAEEMKKITNLSIDKYVIVNMQSFKKFIDDIGGVDLYVEKELRDSLYPTEKKGYQTFSIDKGLHHMNGDTALKYARSRKSTSDFDRARRQQEVIKAIKTTLEKRNDTVQLLENIYDSVKGNIETNISYLEAIMNFNKVRGYTVSSNHVFSTANYLYSTYSTGGQYILLPKAKNFTEMQRVIQDWLKE